MKTPKEKAKELFDIHSAICFDTDKGLQCAIITVDEIISFDIRAKNESQFVISARIEDYWMAVKDELLTFNNKQDE
jgi:hypothetical protein